MVSVLDKLFSKFYEEEEEEEKEEEEEDDDLFKIPVGYKAVPHEDTKYIYTKWRK